MSKYDVENWRHLRSLFVDGEEVIVTEKLHGASARYAYREDRMWVGSRTQWKRQEGGSQWWRAPALAQWIEEWCRQYPTRILFGEVFGQVQDLKYGAKPGEVFFRAFDATLDDGKTWMDADAFVESFTSAQRVPVVYRGAYSRERMETLAIGDSAIAKHLAEGVVIKPIKERFDLRNGRVALKLVSNRYLERS